MKIIVLNEVSFDDGSSCFFSDKTQIMFQKFSSNGRYLYENIKTEVYEKAYLHVFIARFIPWFYL